MNCDQKDVGVASELVDKIASDLKRGEEFDLSVPVALREVLRNFVSLYTDGAEMHNGVEGLPNTTAQLVKLGVCYTKGNFVYLHDAISNAAKENELKRDRLLEKLKRHPANKHLNWD